MQHEVNTGNSPPIYQPPYRIPYAQREKMNEMVDEMLEHIIIEHSTSPWSAPALLVKKKGGSYRFVVDYKKLNNVCAQDPFPIPLVSESLSLIGKAKYFSTMDTLSGFWQLPLAEGSREKSTFSTCDGHFAWKRMAMGLKNAPASWQRAASHIL